MATTAATLVQRTRRFLGDWPQQDAVDGAITASDRLLAVPDGTIYGAGWVIQVGTEAMSVMTAGEGGAIPVRRGVRGTTAAAHAFGAEILIRPHFLDVEYLDAINSGIDASFPLIYQPVVDESITTASATYEYTIPNLDSVPIRAISKLEYKENSDLAFREINAWDVNRGASPKIRLRRDLPTGTLRVIGFSPIAPLADLTSSLNSLFPTNAEDALTYYAAQYLLASGEARRVREDTGAKDERESANRTGSSMAASAQLLQRFQLRLINSAMPPMPKHVKSVI